MFYIRFLITLLNYVKAKLDKTEMLMTLNELTAFGPFIYIYIYIERERETCVYKNGQSPAFFFSSVARRDHGGGLALSESSRGYCRSWYDAEITRNRQWRQCIIEDLPDASKMYDWKYIYIYIYIYIYVWLVSSVNCIVL